MSKITSEEEYERRKALLERQEERAGDRVINHILGPVRPGILDAIEVGEKVADVIDND